MYEIVKNSDSWIKDYIGDTYTNTIHWDLLKGLFQEHAKYKATSPFKKFIEGVDFLTNRQKELLIKKSDSRLVKEFEQLGKKCVVYCIDPDTSEILDVGGSSLLRDVTTGRIEDNLILDNFGKWFSIIMDNQTDTATLKDTTGSSFGFKCYDSSGNFNLNTTGMQGQFGDGAATPGPVTPARSDFKVAHAFSSTPESAPIAVKSPGYTGAFQVVYNVDANPAGEDGTIYEVCTVASWLNTSAALKNIALTHDSVGGIAMTSGKLSRAAYAWQL